MPETLPKRADRDAAGPFASRTGSQWATPAALRLWHLASFDAPTVAVVWSLALAWVCRVRLPLWTLAVLALTVWAIYVADRYLDAQRAIAANQLSGLHERHFFHWRFRRTLAPLALAAAVVAGCLVFVKMPIESFERDSVVAAAALIYFRAVHLRVFKPRETHGAVSKTLTKILAWLANRFQSPVKELLVGVLFAAGCALPAWNRSRLPAFTLTLPVAMFAALAWLDCHAIDRWESEHNESHVAALACVLCWLQGSIAIAVASALPRAAALLLATATSALLLALLDRLRGRITPLALRASVDLVLLTPLALLLR